MSLLSSAISPKPPTAPDADVGRLVQMLARFEALFEAVPLAIAIFDESLLLVRANSRYYELTNLSPTMAAGRSAYDAFPNALADVTDQIDAALRGSAGAPRRLPFQLRNGPRVVEATFAPISEEFGTQGMVFMATDVTEREELRENLARSVAQLESVFDVIPDSVRVFDADGVIVRSNAQALGEHGVVHPQSLGELWKLDRPRTLAGEGLFLHETPTARALRGETVRNQMLAIRRGTDGTTVILEVNANPLRDGAGKIRGAVTVERDVTERTRLARELEEQVRKTAELYERVSTEAERLERMVRERTQELLALQEARARDRRLAAIGQLAAGVMHDVNNALNPIMAASYLLEVNAHDPAAVKDYAARIARAADTGAATAARVGRFIRQEPLQGGEELVDLSVLADEVVAITRPVWSERVRGGTVKLDRALTTGAVVRGIAGEVREALLNLVQNALDAMQAGGTLAITTRIVGTEAFIEVGDTGAGMSAEVRERAFEPFFTTKGHRGTGLGLSEVYGIMKRHRGRAEIESAPGQGTTIRLAFPLASTPVTVEERPAARRRACRVLLVEDNVDGREFMQALLEFEGHSVHTAETVADALSHLVGTEGGLPYDVLLTDIGLPDGSGWDLVASVRARWPALRIGVVTGWEVMNPEGEHVDFILRKPVRTQELLARIAGDD